MRILKDKEPHCVSLLETIAKKNDFFAQAIINSEGIVEISFEVKEEVLSLGHFLSEFGDITYNHRIVFNHAGEMLAKELSQLSGIKITEALLPYYGNGEPNTDIQGHVDGRDFIIVAPVCRSFCDNPILEKKFYSPRDNYDEMRDILQAIGLAGNRLPTSILNMPYLSDAKKDNLEGHSHLPIRTLAQDLDRYSHIRVMLTAFLHCETALVNAIREFRVDNTKLAPPFTRVLECLVMLEELKKESICVASIDSQGLKKVTPIAQALDWPLFIDHKDRKKADHAESLGGVTDDVHGLTVFICDDLIQSFTTGKQGVNAFKDKGAAGVIMVIGSPDFTYNSDLGEHAVNLILDDDFIKKIVVFDTTPLVQLLIDKAREKGKLEKVIVVKYASLLAHYIWRKIIGMTSRDLRENKPKHSLLA